jgi:hypothetical protein
MVVRYPAVFCLAVALFGLSVLSAAEGASNCAGGGYDLTALAGSDIAGADKSYRYLMQFCGTTNEATCKSNGGSLCQYTGSSPPAFSHVLAKWDGTGVWSDCTDPTNCPSMCCTRSSLHVLPSCLCPSSWR